MIRSLSILLCAVLLLFFAAGAWAAPSIGDLHQAHPVTLQTAQGEDRPIRAENEIYTSLALEEQYDGQPQELILLAAKTGTDVGSNGHALTEEIPSIRELAEFFCEDYDLSRLEALRQLTYLLDFKFVATGFRILPEEWEGPLYVKIEGGEITRDSRQEDFVILQFDLEKRTLYHLTMDAYDPETGDFSMAFPCVGPYMITERI